jgi:hypothetical protein
MPYVPTLHYELPHRNAGAFGLSDFGRMAEWITTTWPRFNIFVCWVTLVFLLLAVPGAPPQSSKLEMLLISPLAAPILYVVVVLTSWVAYTLPGMNFVFGAARMFYLWAFCRLVVQPAPHLAFPAWLSERSL